MTHRFAPRTVALGTVLDLSIAPSSRERVFVAEWRGWWLLTTPDAMERAPGYARLFLASGRAERTGEAPDGAGAETYAAWHERDPDRVLELDVPSQLPHLQGRLLRLGYRSDKWGRRGEFEDYEHDFSERAGAPPLIYTDRADIEDSSAALVVGGDMVITERGIA